MSLPYHFDRSPDGQFIRAADWQRNARGIEGQVIARHKYVGHPPFTHSQQCPSGRSDSYDLTGGTTDPWVSQISSFFDNLSNASLSNAYRPDVDFDAYTNTGSPVSCRYLTIVMREASSGYYHELRCARHECSGIPGGVLFQNAYAIVYQHLKAWSPSANSGAGDMIDYEVGLYDDGTWVNGNRALYSGDALGASGTASIRVAGRFDSTGYDNTHGGRTASVTADEIHFHTEDWFTPKAGGDDKGLIYDFYFTLSGGWSLDGTDSIHAELDGLLDQVNLGNASQTYQIDGSSRTLLDGGESVTVTHAGPEDGVPVHYVISSNGSWNWSNNPCLVAENLNDIVTAAGPDGVPHQTPELGDGDVRGTYGYGPWTKIKSAVQPPAGTYVKEVRAYTQPVPDSVTFDFPAAPSNAQAGGFNSVTNTDTGFYCDGSLLAFPPGSFITQTKLSAP